MADVNHLMDQLTLEEKASLTAGEDFFSTRAVERLNIPKIRLTDGPSGARGPSFPGIGGPPCTCIPCGTAIGASWNPDLARELGSLVALEALDRGCRVLLAPTVNLHRSPLAGRNFECYSEDPLLSGRLASGYIQGSQSNGVITTIKHFVGNDAEFERTTISSVIDERALREIYLLPFEIAVREGRTMGLMSAYNRLNGRWLTQWSEYLIDVLRLEWGFRGFVLTDWNAMVDPVVSLGAGLDLEMPGPGRALGTVVADSVSSGLVKESDLDRAVRACLNVFNEVGALDSPELPVEPLGPNPGNFAILTKAAAEGIVLLRNDGTLPLDPASLCSVAVIGPNAAVPCIVGGGSAGVIPHSIESPLQRLSSSLGEGVAIRHERGCDRALLSMPIGPDVLRSPDGFEAIIYEGTEAAGDRVDQRHLDELQVCVVDSPLEGYPANDWSMRIRGTVVPEESGEFEITLAQAGRARLLIDGQLIVDGFTDQPGGGGPYFLGFSSQELVGTHCFERGVPVSFEVEYHRDRTPVAGVRVGFRTVDADSLIDRAVEAAGEADVAVLIVGTTELWETEGVDRDSFELPGRQGELIERVAALDAPTVVVVNAGSTVDMSWETNVGALLQCWFGGEGMAAGVAEVLVGESDPGGRLPTTIPVRLEHNPAQDNFPGEKAELRYGESLFMGYRGYEHSGIVPRYPFGHGLTYTDFEYGELMVDGDMRQPDSKVNVSVSVMNTGRRRGSEVVQCYVAPRSPRIARPLKELKSFAKVSIEPGETAVVRLTLPARAFAFWEPVDPSIASVAGFLSPPSNEAQEPRSTAGWRVDAGSFDILIGRSSADIRAQQTLSVSEGFDLPVHAAVL